MLKNKKADDLTLPGLVRIFLAFIIIVLIVYPAGNSLYAATLGKEKRYTQSFQNFVDNINKMSSGRQSFEVMLKEKSAIIGFSKNTDQYECFNCNGMHEDRPTMVFEKPKNEECINNACICLCREEFQIAKGSFEGKSLNQGQCLKLFCKKIERKDIVGKTILKNNQYWKNGFLFINADVEEIGLKAYKQESGTFVVEKRANVIGVCNTDMMKFNKNELGFDSCLITEYEEAKKLESTNVEEAILKYKEFIQKYKIGIEVEESMLRIGKLYFEAGKYQESADALQKLVTEFPATQYRQEANELLTKLQKEHKVISKKVS